MDLAVLNGPAPKLFSSARMNLGTTGAAYFGARRVGKYGTERPMGGLYRAVGSQR